ncbi:WD40 repeat-like protein [Jaminaea rosea]|uniref:WD40 repeat-like protein n=1 Tax=Jaminaea rosea TaxID=1569628 RepID=A0A316V1M8_9BASI|nr:WD40 repeat-like protein [Jaminaea rosea]PWN31164.1 WD40 repeat-like protein [Jaminaea rosea]
MAASSSKKQRRQSNGAPSAEEDGVAPTPRGRHVFAPYLAMGIVANQIPFVMQVRRGGKDAQRADVNIVTSLGDCWSIWTAESLVQVFVGRSLPSPITSLALSTSPDCILAAAGDTIHRFVRAAVVAKYTTESGPVERFIVFGDSIVAITRTTLHHFSLSTGEEEQAIPLPLSAGVAPTCLVHPATYLHKVLLGLSDGTVQLWNIRTATLLHTFDLSGRQGQMDVATPSILSLAQTPALDVIVATTSDSRIILHNIKEDSCVMAFSLQAQLSSTPPTFRTDGRAHTMAVGSRAGDIFIFDLENQDSREGVARGGRLIHTIRNAHAAPVAGLEFVAGQPLLISSAGDNSIKEWFFEPASSATATAAANSSSSSSSSSSTSLPRLLKSRSGHSSPPHLVRWYGHDARSPLLTAGRDRSLRLSWVGREARGGELSQGSVERKANHLSLPAQSLKQTPASSIAFSLTRSRDWEDILTTHPGAAPRVWLGKDRRMNAGALVTGKKQRVAGQGADEATCAFVTHCGNFGAVGMGDGRVVLWNMQSRRYVRTFDCAGPSATNATATSSSSPGRVVGLAVDEGNTVLTAVLSRGVIVAFAFHSTAVLTRTSQPHAISSARSSPRNTLLALIPVGVSHPLVLLDLATHRVVRRFGPFAARVTDCAFSPTLRSLAVATMDGALATFDVPSGRLMDRMRLREAMLSLDWSPDGGTLAGGGTEGLGVYLWSWTGGRGRVDGDEEEETKEGEVGMPSVRGPEEEEADQAEDDPLALDRLSLADTYHPTSEPLQRRDAPLFTLSMQPRTKWLTLLNLEAIKARDRPKAAEVDKSKAKPAPFFLGMSAATPGSAVDGTKGKGMTDGLGSGATTDATGALTSLGEGGFDGPASGQEEEEARTTHLERSHRLQLAESAASPLEALLLSSDADDAALFSYVLPLSAPQLDLTLRLDLTSVRGVTALLRSCARRVGEAGRDVEGVTAIVESLRRTRWGEMLGLEDEASQLELGEEEEEERRELRAAWSEWLRAVKRANERVGELLDFNIGTLSFLRGLAVV